MLPSSPVSDSKEISRHEDPSLNTSEQLRTCSTDITPGTHQEAPRVFIPILHPAASLDEGVEDGENHVETPIEVRSSPHTINNGAEELATTLQDQSTPINNSESDNEGSNQAEVIIPQIRECDLVQFQSRPAGDSHRLYCVDVLIAGESLNKDIASFKSGRIESWKSGPVANRLEESGSEETSDKWIRRIRINSGAVIKMLRHFCPQAKGFRGQPIVFHRPFQFLISLHQEVKEQLINMMKITFDGLSEPSAIQEISRNKDSLDQLTCFVGFMDGHIMPDSRRYRDSSTPLPATIRYEDLWYLFKPGDLVYVPQDPSAPDRFRSTASPQQILRVVQTNLTNTSLATGPLGLPADSPDWSVLGHFIEHDGASYAPVHYVVPAIQPFGGERKVTDLPVYPISYLEDYQIIDQAVKNGATYVGLIERRSGFYRGWTQTADPYGNWLKESQFGDRVASPEYIESEIIVDFEETFNVLPDWRPSFYQGRAETVKKMDINEFHLERSDLPLIEWYNEENTVPTHFEQVLNTDQTEVIEAKHFLLGDALGQFREDRRKPPTGEYLALLPRRFFAYAVLKRKFVQLNTGFVRSTDFEDRAFERLEIPGDHKRIIVSLVKRHFDNIETERATNVEIETQDLIRDKGKGVVILLHGVPGVGKTATAEAVAHKWKKTLFPITGGDLGYSPEALEKSLSEIFRLAHRWGCILLLEEADVFITKRDRRDLQRNALVSTFMRVLEYYNGILFLTTNQAGVLDEAIKSRVHLSLYYDHLTEVQTMAIFKQHIQRFRELERQRNPDPSEQIMVLHKEILQFARDHFHKRDNRHLSGSNFGRWNGRQIRNAFLMASSLAHCDNYEEGDSEDEDEVAEPGRKKQKQLGRSQFELVARTTPMYDQYRAIHFGEWDDHIAFEREERAMTSKPRSPTPVRMKNTD